MDTENSNPQAAVVTPRPEKKATLRLAQRELTLISYGVILLVVAALGFGIYRVFLNFRSQRDIVIGSSNLNALNKAFKAYADDWDGKLPPAEKWTDAVGGYLSGGRSGQGNALESPGDEAPVHYVYNKRASGYNLERPDKQTIDPHDLVLLIERPGAARNESVDIPPQGNAQGEAALFKELKFPHYADDTERATTLILYADGTVRRLIRRDFTQK